MLYANELANDIKAKKIFIFELKIILNLVIMVLESLALDQIFYEFIQF